MNSLQIRFMIIVLEYIIYKNKGLQNLRTDSVKLINDLKSHLGD